MNHSFPAFGLRVNLIQTGLTRPDILIFSVKSSLFPLAFCNTEHALLKLMQLDFGKNQLTSIANSQK